MQSEIYHSLKNKTVSDLYWLLFSDAPLSDTYDLSPYGLFPPKIIDEWQIASTKYFLELDKNNSEIENFVKRKKNKLPRPPMKRILISKNINPYLQNEVRYSADMGKRISQLNTISLNVVSLS